MQPPFYVWVSNTNMENFIYFSNSHSRYFVPISAILINTTLNQAENNLPCDTKRVLPAIQPYFINFLKQTREHLLFNLHIETVLISVFPRRFMLCGIILHTSASFLSWCGKEAKSSGRLPLSLFHVVHFPSENYTWNKNRWPGRRSLPFPSISKLHFRVMSRIYRYLNAFSAAREREREYNKSRDEGPLCPPVCCWESVCVCVLLFIFIALSSQVVHPLSDWSILFVRND